MSFKRIICLICLGAFEFGCSNQNYVKLPECKQVISLDSTLNLSVSSFLKNSRPKIVTLSNMHRFRMIDIPLLRKQIEENPEFDFIFYVECENLSLLDELKHFVCDNKLQTVLFIDKNQEYRKKNHIHSRVSYISRVVGSNLEIYETTMVGSLYSQFDIIIPKVRKSLKLKN